MDKQSIIERCKKLYAMSQDTSSPYEAQIAAKRVRSLLDQHELSIDDLQASDDFGVHAVNDSFRSVPGWYQVLAVGVAKYNDCRVTINQDTGKVEFKGFDIDAQSAILMLDYLIVAMSRQLDSAKKGITGSVRRFSNSFRQGFANDMQTRLKSMVTDREKQGESAGTSLMVVKRQLVDEKYGAQRVRRLNYTASDAGGYFAGKQASQRTSLNTQVSTSTTAKKRLR